MASAYYTFTGKTKWTKVFKGQEDKLYGHYGLNFYPDDLEAFKATGIQLQEKKDEDGVFFNLRRHPQKLIKGKLVEFGTPVVVDKDGNAFSDSIGNGSTVTVKIVVYDTQKGKGHRLDAVKVDEHIVYVKPGEEEAVPGAKPKLAF